VGENGFRQVRDAADDEARYVQEWVLLYVRLEVESRRPISRV
jgi:hypothetical protein